MKRSWFRYEKIQLRIFSLAMGTAIAFRAEDYSREEAIQKVYDHYAEMNLIFDNLDQCITQEEWDRH